MNTTVWLIRPDTKSAEINLAQQLCMQLFRVLRTQVKTIILYATIQHNSVRKICCVLEHSQNRKAFVIFLTYYMFSPVSLAFSLFYAQKPLS